MVPIAPPRALGTVNAYWKIIAMAFGDSKVEAIRAALNTGRVHVLITDLATAEKIVRLP